MKPSDKVLLSVFVTAAIATGLLYWWIPDMHYGVYIGFWFVVAAAGYGPALREAADKKALDKS
ncbi:hypothetical protein [Pseudomonas putida]|uniref:hypothetical protein n=1 Tax=Pseudomonas putida TaxID=303 RepID=UPI002DB91E52|nr:hypothetical protein [Pseudomonas putida]WRW04675.1 hypothetical protein VPZ82_04440 [Pseudomonas putida]